jgi:hypothetical protein
MERDPEDSVLDEPENEPGAVRSALDALLGDLTLVSIALAGALAWGLVQVASGVGRVVQGLLLKPDAGFSIRYDESADLTWIVGGRVLTLYELAVGVAEFAVVLGVALLVHRRYRSSRL